MNKNLVANICIVVMAIAVIAAFMGEITWGDVGLTFIGTLVFSILNGVIIGRILRKHLDK